ncbi:MAG: inorganic diphosphatase [bacterium]
MDKYLNKTVTVKMDRPLGSNHPKHGFRYEVNYGFIPNTKMADGEELDAYVIGPNKSLDEFTGTCIAYIERTDDIDDPKLIVVSDDKKDITDTEIMTAVNFQEKFFRSVVKRK